MDKLQQQLVEHLAAEIDKKLDRRLGSIERHINAVGSEVETVAKQAAFLLRQQGVTMAEEDDGDEIIQADETWQCVKCGCRLGYYDPTEDLLRMRHKDILFWLHLGVGGKFSYPCRKCGELNTVEWEPAAEE